MLFDTLLFVYYIYMQNCSDVAAFFPFAAQSVIVDVYPRYVQSMFCVKVECNVWGSTTQKYLSYIML